MDMNGQYLVRSRMNEELVVPWHTTIIDVCLQYWPNDNLITDADGEVIYDIFSIIAPNDLAMFKDRPYWSMYFLHAEKKGTVVGISYKDPFYFESGDYKRYPTMKDQMDLRRLEQRNGCESAEENFEFRRRKFPELY